MLSCLLVAVFREIRAEETRLRGAGLLDVLFVLELLLRRLLQRLVSAPVLSPSSWFLKKRHLCQARTITSGICASILTPSAVSLTLQDIV